MAKLIIISLLNRQSFLELFLVYFSFSVSWYVLLKLGVLFTDTKAKEYRVILLSFIGALFALAGRIIIPDTFFQLAMFLVYSMLLFRCVRLHIINCFFAANFGIFLACISVFLTGNCILFFNSFVKRLILEEASGLILSTLCETILPTLLLLILNLCKNFKIFPPINKPSKVEWISLLMFTSFLILFINSLQMMAATNFSQEFFRKRLFFELCVVTSVIFYFFLMRAWLIQLSEYRESVFRTKIRQITREEKIKVNEKYRNEVLEEANRFVTKTVDASRSEIYMEAGETIVNYINYIVNLNTIAYNRKETLDFAKVSRAIQGLCDFEADIHPSLRYIILANRMKYYNSGILIKFTHDSTLRDMQDSQYWWFLNQCLQLVIQSWGEIVLPWYKKKVLQQTNFTQKGGKIIRGVITVGISEKLDTIYTRISSGLTVDRTHYADKLWKYFREMNIEALDKLEHQSVHIGVKAGKLVELEFDYKK